MPLFSKAAASDEGHTFHFLPSVVDASYAEARSVGKVLISNLLNQEIVVTGP